MKIFSSVAAFCFLLVQSTFVCVFTAVGVFSWPSIESGIDEPQENSSSSHRAVKSRRHASHVHESDSYGIEHEIEDSHTITDTTDKDTKGPEKQWQDEFDDAVKHRQAKELYEFVERYSGGKTNKKYNEHAEDGAGENFFKYSRRIASSRQTRRLSVQNTFKPNTAKGECNSTLKKQKCKSFSEFLKEVNTKLKPVVVPCGICLKVDITDGRTVELPHGLNVIGKLLFGSDARVTIRTTAVLVQGVFKVLVARKRRKLAPIPFGESKVRIVLYGDKDLSFLPYGINKSACGLNADTNTPIPCKMGTKPFFVAGGQTDINAMEGSCPTFAKLESVASNGTKLTLSDPKAANCWGKGAELVFASDSIHASDFQYATILNKKNGVFTLKKPLEYIPTTAKQNPLYAVEVHLNNRNFVIEAEPSDAIGGHFIVHQTPHVQQIIKGVEFKNMGQQGVLGRYPIHFHMSEDCKGSIISRNLIKNSFQRCVVVHGTHNVTIEYNVAFDTFGHCFMTEDGGEYDNEFKFNLGHYTRKMPQDKLLSSDASDHNPATFWWTNSKNTFIGNIAAGSEAHGIWFELHAKVRGPSKELDINQRVNPRVQNLGIYRNNVAHSNRKHGLTTYKTGMLPREQGVFENQISFRNGQSGMFIHNSENLKVLGGHFADNVDGIRILQAKDIVVDGTTFVALSKSHYNSVQMRDTKLWAACKKKVVSLAGVTWTPSQNPFTGPIIMNAKFEDYNNTICKSIAIDAERSLLRDKMQLSTVKLSNLSYSSTSNTISACRAIDNMATNIAVEDFDGSISGTRQPGFFVQENQAMVNFLTTPCNANSKDFSCLKHCPGVCLRNFIVNIPGIPHLQQVSMKIKSASGQEAAISRRYTGDGMHVQKFGTYAVHLPFGNFSVSFEDKDGNPTWPIYVSPTFEKEPQCAHNLKVEHIKFEMPSANREVCNDLIYNGDFESGNVHGWQRDFCDIAVLDGGAEMSKFGLRTINRKSLSFVRQVLDQSCLAKSGFQDYTIKGSFRLVDGNKDVSCDANIRGTAAKACPTVYLYAGSMKKKAFTIETKFTDGRWTDFSQTITVPPRAEKNEQVHLEFHGGGPGEYYLDNFSMRKTSYDGSHFVPFSAHGIYMEVGRHRPVLEENRQVFDKLLNESPHGIVKRFCMGCQESHKTIFYRRWSSHEGVSLLEYFEESFKEVKNRFNVDFSLYSTHEDAVADRNRWNFCSFDDNKGFPGGCGPSHESVGQFNRYSATSWLRATDVVFSVERSGEGGHFSLVH